jgi:hypothetical protein
MLLSRVRLPMAVQKARKARDSLLSHAERGLFTLPVSQHLRP